MSVGLSTATSMRRRNSISSFIPIKLHLPTNTTTTSSFPNATRPFASFNLELASLRPPSYTSLVDLLPTSPAVLSPTTTTQTCTEISIRNRLVKQAAWAYLQPMAPSPDSAAGHHFLHRFWVRFSGDYLRIPVAGFLCFFRRRVLPTIRSALSRLLGVFSFGVG